VARQDEPDRGGGDNCNHDAVPRILFGDPVHVAMQLSANHANRAIQCDVILSPAKAEVAGWEVSRWLRGSGAARRP
jgi:hypothetical protein